MKIAIISSCGGHLAEVRTLANAYSKYDHFYVINDHIENVTELKAKVIFIKHSERDFYFFYNLFEAYVILKREKPDVLLSTGAGPIVPFTIIALLFFKTHIIYIETMASIEKPSLTGRIMYYLVKDFYYQWKTLTCYFPKGICGKPLL
jgi:UDP-N-acetylglucosamine:LPS N-acetylglucosamine transferase